MYSEKVFNIYAAVDGVILGCIAFDTKAFLLKEVVILIVG